MIKLNKVFRANPTNREEWVRIQLEKVPPGMKILDVGSGGQPYRKYCNHLTYKAHDFCLLDPSSQIIEGKYGPVDYVSEISHIPEKDSSFDVILCTEVIEHVPYPISALKEMSRLLKPSGKLILTAPLGSFLHQEPYHFYGGFTPYWYEKFLAEAGFTDIRIQPNGGFFRFFGQECQRVTRILFRRRPLTSSLRWFLLPFEIISTVVFTILSPMFCYLFDKLMSTPLCTIGYHVTARKK